VARFELELVIRAPIERVFDLARSVDAHVASTPGTEERAVGGKTSGLLGLGEEVTWEARHFGVLQRLTSRITIYERPRHFRDSMVSGAFRRFDHDHFFEARSESETLCHDVFDYDAPLGPLGRIAEAVVLTRYMRRFLEVRLRVLKDLAEHADAWRAHVA
jgi:ligand-binding SRPBCC domain-containing protein